MKQKQDQRNSPIIGDRSVFASLTYPIFFFFFFCFPICNVFSFTRLPRRHGSDKMLCKTRQESHLQAINLVGSNVYFTVSDSLQLKNTRLQLKTSAQPY